MSTGNFWCVDCTCGAKNSARDFQLETTPKKEDHMKCPNNKKITLKHLGYTTSVGIQDPKVHAKGRTPAERTKRRVDDFKKNTMPKLTGSDLVHFEKKYGRIK